MELSGFLTYAIALGIAAAIPGPGVIALVARALGSGLKPAIPMMLGLVLGDVLYLSAAVLGLAFIASTFGQVFVVIRYAGAIYLLYIAWKFLRAGSDIQAIESRQSGGALAAFLSGLAVTLGNPKVIVFYLALLPTILDLKSVSVPDLAILIGLTAMVLCVVLVPYVALAGRARTVLRSPAKIKLLNRIAAGSLTGAAALIAAKT